MPLCVFSCKENRKKTYTAISFRRRYQISIFVSNWIKLVEYNYIRLLGESDNRLIDGYMRVTQRSQYSDLTLNLTQITKCIIFVSLHSFSLTNFCSSNLFNDID